MKTKDLVLCAMFVALIAVGAFIKVPVPVVPFTLQFLFTMLAGLLLGPVNGALAVVVYIVLGLVGLPIFTQGGGPGWETVRYTPHVAAIVAIEPGGAAAPGSAAYKAMAEQKIPVTFYYGDYIGNDLPDIPAAAMWQRMAETADTFTAAYEKEGLTSTVVHLPKLGIK